jgi:hypothetical protein
LAADLPAAFDPWPARERSRLNQNNLRNAPHLSKPTIPPSSKTGEVSVLVGEGAGVGSNIAKQVLVVQKESPRLFEQIKAGTVTANDAYTQVRANRPSDDRKPKAPKMVILKTHEGTEVPYAAASKPTFNRRPRSSSAPRTVSGSACGYFRSSALTFAANGAT